MPKLIETRARVKFELIGQICAKRRDGTIRLNIKAVYQNIQAVKNSEIKHQYSQYTHGRASLQVKVWYTFRVHSQMFVSDVTQCLADRLFVDFQVLERLQLN